ncbi:hypothetical protein PS627_02588 [Pseudomonas fluorescens]|nr:hypothetical protein PS627_02588 [Pseudomonas fluorescens]
MQLDRLPRRIEAQGVAQQVVHGTLQQRRPALEGQAGRGLEADLLVRGAEQGVLAHAAKQGVEVDGFGMGLFGINPGQGKDFTDQVFQTVALAGQAWPQGLALLGLGAFGQGQGNAQARQRGAQFVGDVAQQLALAANETLQAGTHAVEVVGQHAEFITPVGQTCQAVLLVGGLAQVMYGAAQAAQRTGDRQGHQQAEQGQHHQGNAQGAERPEQALAVPGVEPRVRDPVDQQVSLAALGTGVFLGQAAPGQAAVIVLTGLEGRRAAREGTGHHGFATVVEHLHVDLETLPAALEKVLGRFDTLLFVVLGPAAGQGIEPGMAAEDPGVLVQHVAKQDRQPGDQGDGQPEAGQDAPEQ